MADMQEESSSKPTSPLAQSVSASQVSVSVGTSISPQLGHAVPSNLTTTTSPLTTSTTVPEIFEVGEAVRPAEATVPPDLFKQLNEMSDGYTFDETKPPFHSVCAPPSFSFPHQTVRGL